MASLADIILQGGRDQANSALQLAQIEADRRNANAQNITHSIATLADVFGKIPQQIAQNKRQAVEDQANKLALGQQQQAVQGQADINQIIAGLKPNEDGVLTFDPAQLRQSFAAKNIPIALQTQTFAALDGMNKSLAGFTQARIDHAADFSNSVLSAFPTGAIDPQSLMLIMAPAKANGLLDDKTEKAITTAVQNGADPRQLLTAFRDQSEKYKGKAVSVAPGAKLVNDTTGAVIAESAPRPVSVAPGASLVNPDSGQPVYSAPAAAPTLQSKDVLVNGKRAIVNFNPKDGKMYDPTSGKEVTGATPIPPVSAASNSETGGNAKDIADAIASGDQPPTLTGLYRLAGPVRAELARSGYNLTKATEDWTSTQKYLNTLNGAQQVRLRQAVEFTRESLPVVRQLISEWDSSGLPYLSKANIDAAAKGTYGDKQQSLAVRLKGQIADITSELGTVYKGGNSSTDESLKLAAENLQGDWSKKAGLDALDQIEKNLTIRSNSIKNTGVVGNSDNAYAPKTGAAPSGTAPDPKDPLGILK